MSEDIERELRYRCMCAPHCNVPEECDMCSKEHCIYCTGADTIEALRGEVERLTKARVECERQFQTKVEEVAAQMSRAEKAEAEAARLKGALAVIASDPTHSGQAMIARKALAGEAE